MSKKKLVIVLSSISVALIIIAGSLFFILSRYETGEDESFIKIPLVPNAATITMDDCEASRGEKITVPVYINNNPGIAASAFSITFNSEKLKFTGYRNGDVFSSCTIKSQGNQISYATVENGDVIKSGVLFYLDFKVKRHAKKGPTEIYTNIDRKCFCNYDEEYVDCYGSNAEITIK